MDEWMRCIDIMREGSVHERWMDKIDVLRDGWMEG